MDLVAMPKDFISWMSYSPQAAAHTASKRKDQDTHLLAAYEELTLI